MFSAWRTSPAPAKLTSRFSDGRGVMMCRVCCHEADITESGASTCDFCGPKASFAVYFIHGLAKEEPLSRQDHPESQIWVSPSGCETPVEPGPAPHVADALIILGDTLHEDAPFLKSRSEQEAANWSSKELKFTLDAHDIQKLNAKELKLFEYILAFFATADGEVLENTVNYSVEAESSSIRLAYDAQAYYEGIHMQTYADALAVYAPDRAHRQELTMAFKTDPLIRERDEWMSQYIPRDSSGVESELKKAKRVVAFVCAEGLFFMSAFMIIAWLRSRDLFPIFARANELISRDEWMHVKLGVARFKRFFSKKLGTPELPTSEVVKIVEEAVALELKFLATLIPRKADADRFDSFHYEFGELHVKNIANKILTGFGIEPIYKDLDMEKQPDWVKWIEMQIKASFYETAVTVYTMPIAESENPERDTNW